MEDHYHLTTHISKEQYKKLEELSELLNSKKFKALRIEILPADLIPEYLQDELVNYLLHAIAAVKRLRDYQ